MNKQTQAAAQAASSTDLQTLLGDGLARRWWQSITLWLGLLALVAVAALAVDFRARIAVATGVMLFLAVAGRSGLLHALPLPAAVSRLAQISYSVFLVHFSVCLLVNAVVNHLWPDAPWPNLLGMVLAFGLSIAAGRLLYLRVERHVPSWSVALRWQAGMVGTGMLVALASSRF